MRLRKRARPFIRKLLYKKTEGGAQVMILAMMFILCIIIFFALLIDETRITVTHENVDDALTTSLLSACVTNSTEYSISESTVIYKTVTPVPVPNVIGNMVDGTPIYQVVPTDVVNGSDILSPSSTELDKSYERFLKNLKQNLNLDASMNANISGIDGVVSVDEFAVYNKYYNLDALGNQTDFRFVKYTYNSTGLWSVYPYSINTYPTCYNSLTKSMYTVTETSVTATLSFDVLVMGDKGSYATGVTTPVSYTRIVDVVKR